MSALSPDALHAFRKIFFHTFEEELSESECARRADQLIELYKAVYLPGNEHGEGLPQ
jgi:hypothetical protein